ncbi:MAG: RNA methyltransferase [Gemmatimonadales bacterium]
MGNALHTLVRDLHRRRGRERRGLALVEGVRLVEEAVAAGLEFRAVLAAPALEATERGRALKAALARRPEFSVVSDAELEALAATEQPQGVLAVVVPRRFELDDLGSGPGAVLLVLDAIQDPGNVGTIIRTALGLGAAGVIALPGTAELTNPKTLRAAMGAAFRLPVVAVAEAAAAEWLGRHRFVIAATAADGKPIGTVPLPEQLALVLGNEGAGLTSGLGLGAALRLAIPLAPGVESLTVAVAAGIILHGACRERTRNG